MPLFTRRPESNSVLSMRCLSCHGPVLKSTAPVTISQDGYRLTWESVPAWVCKLCGRSYFEPGEVERIRSTVQTLREQH